MPILKVFPPKRDKQGIEEDPWKYIVAKDHTKLPATKIEEPGVEAVAGVYGADEAPPSDGECPCRRAARAKHK